MPGLLNLSARSIDTGIRDEPVNRVTQEPSELAGKVAMVESFSHSVAFRTDDGLVVFDASSAGSGAFRADAESRGEPAPRVIAHEAVPKPFERYRATASYNKLINLRHFGWLMAAGRPAAVPVSCGRPRRRSPGISCPRTSRCPERSSRIRSHCRWAGSASSCTTPAANTRPCG